MRRNRIILLLLWIASLVGISFYGGPVSYGFFGVLTLIPVISLIYIVCVILQFKIYQRIENRYPISNRTSVFYFTLQNESLMTFAGIRVFFYSTFSTISGLEDAIEYELSPHTGIKKQTELVCKYRGEYEVGIKKIIAQDFFRLFSVSYKNREPLRVKVKPNIVTLTQLRTDQNISASREARMHRVQPDVTVREYMPYDDRRMVHWKATAATQKLMVRERTDEQQKGIAIVMSPKRCSKKQEIYLPVENKILETVIALAFFYSSRNIPVSVFYRNVRYCESVIGQPRHFDGFYEQMSEYAFDEQNEPGLLYEEILRAGSVFESREVFLILHERDEREASFINVLSRNGLSVTTCLITDSPVDVSDPERIPRCKLVTIRTDDDLTEVM